jgi:ankyrin repeat protein
MLLAEGAQANKPLEAPTAARPFNAAFMAPPLSWAAMWGRSGIASLLIQAGADLDAVDTGTGRTALHWAVASTADTITSRYETIFNPHCLDPEGALNLREKHREDLLPILLRAGANPNVKDYEGRTVLHLAVWGKAAHWLVADPILRAGADPNAADLEGDTPLHLALRMTVPGRGSDARLLLEFGAMPDLPNNAGQTPLDIAVLRGLDGVVSLLREHLPATTEGGGE